MQEEVTQKTIALSVNVGKGAARLTEQALQKAIKKFLEQKSKAPHTALWEAASSSRRSAAFLLP